MEHGTIFSTRVDLIPGLDRKALRRQLNERRGLGLRSDLAIASQLGAGDRSRRRDDASACPAAVLVPVVVGDGATTVLLTRRTDHLHHHGGQISFPGGRLERDDTDAVACALREAEEETGLSPRRVEVLGVLDDYLTVTGFRVVPVVGLVHPPFDLTPDPFEVAEAFEVPLTFLLDPANHQKVARTINGCLRPYYAMSYGNHYIWGATAAILMNLYHVLKSRETAKETPC